MLPGRLRRAVRGHRLEMVVHHILDGVHSKCEDRAVVVVGRLPTTKM